LISLEFAERGKLDEFAYFLRADKEWLFG